MSSQWNKVTGNIYIRTLQIKKITSTFLPFFILNLILHAKLSYLLYSGFWVLLGPCKEFHRTPVSPRCFYTLRKCWPTTLSKFEILSLYEFEFDTPALSGHSRRVLGPTSEPQPYSSPSVNVGVRRALQPGSCAAICSFH